MTEPQQPAPAPAPPAYDPEKARKAFADLRTSLRKLEDRVAGLERGITDAKAELPQRLDYIRACQAKIDRYSAEMSDGLSRLNHAEAVQGKQRAEADKLWAMMGQATGDIVELRARLTTLEGKR